MELTQENVEIFAAVADTILPAVEGDGPAWTSSATDLGLHRELHRLFHSLPHDDDRRDLLRLFGLLSSSLGGLVLYRRPKPLAALSAEERARAFRAMETSPIGLVRAGARTLQALTALAWTTTSHPARPPVAWEAMGYPGPGGTAPQVPKEIEVTRVEADTTMEADVVVVGSGAGGGTAAGVLAGAGLRVVVLEAGGYHHEADFTQLEADAYRRLYLQGALGTTRDRGMVMLAGATLGGGTVVNYATAFPTPESQREEWDRESGLDGVFTGEEYQRSSQSVLERLEVNEDPAPPATRDLLMEKGLRALGWHVGIQPRSAMGCVEEECGFCGMGCRTGAKRTTLSTYLRDALEQGATIVTGAQVGTVIVEEGRAAGVVAAVGGHTLTVRARAVVLAAGALNTPAILLRSGVGGPAAGRYLRTHPGTAVWGRFAEPVEMWNGILQARYSDQFVDLDGDGYGFKFETVPVHPQFPAALIGWESGPAFKRDVLGLGHLSLVGILLRDRGHGRVTLRRDGSPVWSYRISRHDQGHIREGILRGAEVMAAAGAGEVISPSVVPVRWRPKTESFDRFVHGVYAAGYGPHRVFYVSFHQMGSARMGADPGRSVVGGDNQAHDTPGLYVMDASCFPTASGVNPLVSVATIAHRGATLLAERLA